MKDYLKENVRFVMKTELIIGEGSAKDLAARLQGHGWNRIGLIVDKGLYDNNDYAREIAKALEGSLDRVILLVNGVAEPTYDYLDEIRTQFENDELDCFVGIGGGSTMDLAKGLATLQTNHGRAIEYRGFEKMSNAPLPVVGVPSTAGTGSEVTPYAVFIDSAAKWKFGINTEHNYPRMAVYDPGFLSSCPFKVYASAGMDAMTHTLESFAARDATAISRMFSLKAFKLLFENLKKLAKGDRDIATKLNLQVGAGCAGAALMNSGGGPSGALSYPLGVYFDVPHGMATSVWLPEVIKYNTDNGYLDYAELYDLVFPGDSATAKEKSVKFAEEIKTLAAEMGVPTDLKGFGVTTEADLQLILDNSQQLEAAFKQNPVVFGQEQIRNVLYALR